MRVGDPDNPATLVCHRPAHLDPDHYDAAEQVWWRPCTGEEPEFYRREPPPRPTLRDTSP